MKLNKIMLIGALSAMSSIPAYAATMTVSYDKDKNTVIKPTETSVEYLVQPFYPNVNVGVKLVHNEFEDKLFATGKYTVVFSDNWFKASSASYQIGVSNKKLLQIGKVSFANDFLRLGVKSTKNSDTDYNHTSGFAGVAIPVTRKDEMSFDTYFTDTNKYSISWKHNF